MKLVKDLTPSGIAYFWIDENSEKISPDIPTFQLAEEWHTRFVFSQYTGEERRQSFLDRRKDQYQREQLDTNLFASRENPEGRRNADRPVEVDIDLVVDKLKIYYN